MSFVVCRHCGWRQDDFWTEDVHPFSGRFVKEWSLLVQGLLQGEREIVFDMTVLDTFNTEMISPPKYKINEKDEVVVDVREWLDYELRRTGQRIVSMRWPTERSFLDSDRLCPICRQAVLLQQASLDG